MEPVVCHEYAHPGEIHTIVVTYDQSAGYGAAGCRSIDAAVVTVGYPPTFDH